VRIAIVGTFFGGAIALASAFRFPARFDRLVPLGGGRARLSGHASFLHPPDPRDAALRTSVVRLQNLQDRQIKAVKADGTLFPPLAHVILSSAGKLRHLP
jgi:pimeloyl-ACP methyl ester carboxylesterase